ncbi:sensor domain-containing protein [Clostridium thermarum]|uniref:sensor domain-containing protein n=1 Tax=Clostridium thermarum TaxID=1716543 RepID=UPI0013D0F4B9|nr:EAL domain-containing protein [Clostridium thermarum]
MEKFEMAEICEKDIEHTVMELMKKQEELKKSEERYRVIIEATKDIIWEMDLTNHKWYFNGKLYDILGYSPEELENLEAWFNIIHPSDIELVREAIREQSGKNIEVHTFEYRVKCKDGTYKWLVTNSKCEYDEGGKPIKAFGVLTDITELKEQQKRIYDLAYYDPVTGLPNRIMLAEIINEKIKKANESKSKFSMIYIDLDNFKVINDSYGHSLGDKLLVEVSKRLKEINRNKINSFRLGGDEFIVLMEDIKDKEEVEQLSRYLHKVLASVICIDGKVFHITHSSGAVIYPDHGTDFNELLKNADTAMYKSKEAGRGNNSFYDDKMGEAAIEKIKIEADLHKAIENNEFELYYQPIVDVADARIKGCEALVRWIHPKEGMISPAKFISIAEENGTIIEIGRWVFENACKYAKKMYDRGYTDFYVSVNISPHQLLQKEFTDLILKTIEKVGVAPELILIEITESVLIESMNLAVRKLKKLRDKNIKIALDDFGCGYSSLTYLRTLPINLVKVDRSFISDIKSEEDTQNITNIIILLAKQLGLKVIAEGVENHSQLNYLKKHKCDMFQGYLVSKPVPEEKFIKLLK